MTTIIILLSAIVLLNVARLCLAIRQSRNVGQIVIDERIDRDLFLTQLTRALDERDTDT